MISLTQTLNQTLKAIRFYGWLGLLLCSPGMAANNPEPATNTSNADRAISTETQGMTITGDHEMPQVLYIIPWQEQRAAMPAAPTLKYLIQQPLTPCDTGQTLGEYQADLWNCLPNDKALSR